MFLWILADNEHLSDVTFGLNVAFETIVVATLLFAYLTVPSQTLETSRFHGIVKLFGGAGFCARHDGLCGGGRRRERFRDFESVTI